MPTRPVRLRRQAIGVPLAESRTGYFSAIQSEKRSNKYAEVENG
jgi:hypothetical protein